MANTIRVKRRASGGAAGAPSSLENGELAFNEVDSILYYGVGTGGAGGSATSIIGIAGPGAVVTLTGAQTISGNKTFSGTVDVPTVSGASNSTSAASTAWVRGYAQAALGFTPENAANKGQANGYASLGADGLVPANQLPAAVAGGLNYIGTWNASTNSPSLADGSGTKGNYYKVSTAGNTSVGGNANWTVGDLIVYNGATWDKFEGGAPDVVSVAGRIGAVVISYTDVTGTYAVGDLLQASSTSALSRLAAVATGNVLLSGGVTTASSWGKVGLTTHVSGTLPVANGGTGAVTLTGHISGNGTGAFTASATIPMSDISGVATVAQGGTSFATYAVGDLLQASAAGTLAKLAAVATGNVLLSGGVATVSAWGKVGLTTHVTGTLPVANGGTGTTTSTGTGNVVLSASPTFTGTAAFAAVTATSFTGPLTGNVSGTATNVTGVVAVANGGSGVATLTGYLKGNGTSAFTGVSTIPNTDITGLGTMSTQSASAVAITGGTIDGITLDGGTF